MRPIRDIFRSYGVLDSEGRHINGTDKETNHSYGEAYEFILSVQDDSIPTRESQPHIKLGPTYRSIRPDVKLMMEVGIADGSSLLAWREVFPNALCVGMDIHHSDKAHGDRIEFHRGDATQMEDCRRASRGRKTFDFIVEDATHVLGDTLQTLLFLWPYVRPGGLYLIEEFANIGSLIVNITDLWPCAEVIPTIGPFGGIEPLVVLRKPL